MTIILTPDMEKIVEEKLHAGDFATAEEVVFAGLQALQIHAVDDRHLKDNGSDEVVHSAIPSKERFTALILEGLDSPLRERTKADFDKTRQEIIERHRQSRSQ